MPAVVRPSLYLVVAAHAHQMRIAAVAFCTSRAPKPYSRDHLHGIEHRIEGNITSNGRPGYS